MIDPIAFQLGTITVRWYGIMMAICLICGFLFWKQLAKKYMSKTQIIESYLLFIIGLFIGARLFHALVYNFNYFYTNPIKIFYLWQGGLSSHGAIIGGTLAGYTYCKKENLSPGYVSDLATIPVAFAIGFVRIGNFFNQELVGRIITLPWAVNINNESRHPVQLYESAKNFFIFGILLTLHQIKSVKLPEGSLYWLFIFLFSFLRFFTEFFKDYLIFSSGLTMGQWLSIVFMVPSGIMLFRLMIKHKIQPHKQD